VALHETLLRDLYNVLQQAFDPKPLNPQPILVILNRYVYQNELFNETERDTTKYLSDLEQGIMVIDSLLKLIMRIEHEKFIRSVDESSLLNQDWISFISTITSKASSPTLNDSTNDLGSLY
jgi:hypothetical protein